MVFTKNYLYPNIDCRNFLSDICDGAMTGAEGLAFSLTTRHTLRQLNHSGVQT